MRQIGKLWLSLLFCIPVLLFGGCGLFGGNDGKLHEGYYREIIMEPNGNLIGKLPISDSDAKKGGLSYKVTMGKDADKDKVQSVMAVYGNTPVDTVWPDALRSGLNDSFSEIVVTHDENGIKYEFKNAKGNGTPGFYHASSIRFKLDDKKQTTSAYLYDSQGNVGLGKGLAVAQLVYKYDDNGRITQVDFTDENGVPAPFSYKGGSTLQFLYENEKYKNLVTNLSWHDDKGDYAPGPLWGEAQYTYDDQGRITQIAHKDKDGQPQNVNFAFGWGQPGSPETGMIKDLDGFRYNNGNGFVKGLQALRLGVVEPGTDVTYTYKDKSIYPVKIAFEKDNKNSVFKVSEYQMAYDEQGQITSLSAYDANGQPTAFIHKNIDTVKLAYDTAGHITEKSFFSKGNPASLETVNDPLSHVAKIQYTYDESGQVVAENYTDITGEPGERHIYGAAYSKLGIQYDGDKASFLYYGKNGEALDVDPMYQFYGKWKRGSGSDGLIVDISKDKIDWTVMGNGRSTHHYNGSYRILDSRQVNTYNGGGKLSLSFNYEPGRSQELELNRNPDTKMAMSIVLNYETIYLQRVK